ncbi:MAG: phytanoyl-CoA dioxygenase family protein [Pyrinomonadaceae bacterium]|nr:phytanoyl-CoA dioxygenase family protein [Pyrinomonadaceae bacterium]
MRELLPEQIVFFRENGFLILRGLLEPEDVNNMKEAVLRIIDGFDDGIRSRSNVQRLKNRVTVQIQQLYQANPLIAEFIKHPKLGEIASVLMNDTPEVRLWHDQVIYKPAKTGGPVAWHQDYFYWQHTDAPDMVTAWCALSEVTEENGCMYVVPGSHRFGMLENRYLADDHELEYIFACLPEEAKNRSVKIPLILEPGDVTFHHPLLIHGSYNNDSDKDRLGYIMHFFPKHLRYLEKFDTLKQDNIKVPDGSLIRGENFPLVWSAHQTN